MGEDDAVCVDWRVVGCGDFGGFCSAEVEVLNGVRKSIDSGCCDWTGGVGREIPRDYITVLIGKRLRFWTAS